MNIDINSDMGEAFGPYVIADDEALMGVITSANVACGSSFNTRYASSISGSSSLFCDCFAARSGSAWRGSGAATVAAQLGDPPGDEGHHAHAGDPAADDGEDGVRRGSHEA